MPVDLFQFQAIGAAARNFAANLHGAGATRQRAGPTAELTVATICVEGPLSNDLI